MPQKFSSKDIKYSCEQSLKRLGTDYIDIYQLHNPRMDFINNDEVIEVNPAKVDRVVDTTGAGDLYAGGFLFGMAKGKDLATCGNYASIAAAEIISHYGARPLVKLSNLI